MNAGRPQLYGTQITADDAGEIVPQPIQEPDQVDQRRAAVGLASLAEYLNDVRAFNSVE